MKCHIMWHFIKVFTVCQSTCLGVSSLQRVKDDNLLIFFIMIDYPIHIDTISMDLSILTMCILMSSSFWFDTMDLRWIIIGVAPVRQLRMCKIKIVTFKMEK